MGIGEIIVAVGAIGGLFTGIWKLIIKTKEAKTLSDKLDKVSEGLVIVEEAVEQNKALLDKTPAGKKITATIKEYGPAAKQAVDEARKIAREVDADK